MALTYLPGAHGWQPVSPVDSRRQVGNVSRMVSRWPLDRVLGRPSKPEAKPNLWRIRVEGGEAEQLTDEKGDITAFQWSPDGSQIAFSMPESENEDEEEAKKESGLASR